MRWRGDPHRLSLGAASPIAPKHSEALHYAA